MRKFALVIIVGMVTIFLLPACSQTHDPAAIVVEDYFNALVKKDADALSALSCADWESNALIELDSLQAVETRLENLVCTSDGKQGTIIQVNCQGKIVATYNNEDQELDLSVRTYQVIQQGGDYLYCGYK
jgi:hypothetical protein